MKITLRKIWEHYPCCENLGTHDADIEVSLMQILESNGLNDAVWALRCFDYIDQCLFLADVAESVLDILEKSTGYKDNSIRRCICGIHLFHDKLINEKEMTKLAFAAFTAAYAATNINAPGAYAAYAACLAVYAIDVTISNAVYVAYAAVHADESAKEEKRKEIEILFIKHFGGK